jgi:hypothetical protein
MALFWMPLMMAETGFHKLTATELLAEVYAAASLRDAFLVSQKARKIAA